MADTKPVVQPRRAVLTPVRYVYRRVTTPIGSDVILVDLWSDGIRDERYMNDTEKAAHLRTGGHRDA